MSTTHQLRESPSNAAPWPRPYAPPNGAPCPACAAFGRSGTLRRIPIDKGDDVVCSACPWRAYLRAFDLDGDEI